MPDPRFKFEANFAKLSLHQKKGKTSGEEAEGLDAVRSPARARGYLGQRDRERERDRDREREGERERGKKKRKKRAQMVPPSTPFSVALCYPMYADKTFSFR